MVQTDPPQTIGALLRHLRTAQGWSVPQLSARSGVHENAIRRIERGQTLSPHRHTQQRLVAALKLSDQQRRLFESMAGTPARSGGIPLPLVGRRDELYLASEHLRAGDTPFLLFSGEPGMGKSRLLEQIEADAIVMNMRVMRGRSLRLAVQEPYSPIADALRSYLDGPFGYVRERLTGSEWLALALPELYGPPFLLPRWNPPPGGERHLIFEAMQRLLQGAMRPGGTLLLLDDVQWAGEDALDLLTMLLTSSSIDRLRIVGACRDTELQQPSPFARALAHWRETGTVRQVPIEPLREDDASALFDAVVAEFPVDSTLKERALRRGEGVPFFVMSLALSITAAGEGRGSQEQIPLDLTHSIEARLSALSPLARDVVGIVALMDTASVTVIAQAVDASNRALVLALEEACGARILETSAADAYRVNHEIIREVVQGGLSPARRQDMHASIADALERAHGHDSPQIVAVLAQHFTEANEKARALSYRVLAGDNAGAVFAHREAEAQYREALRLARALRDRDAEAMLAEKLGATQIARAEYRSALETLSTAVRQNRARVDLNAEGRVHALIARAYMLDGRPHDGAVYVETIVQSLGSGVSPAILSSLYAVLAECRRASGQFIGALDAADTAIELARTVGDPGMIGSRQVQRGLALLLLGRRLEGGAALQTAVPLVESEGELATLTHALRELGWVYLSGGEYERGLDCRKRALVAAEKMQNPALEAVELANLAFARIVGGEWKRARVEADRAVTTMREIGTPASATYPLFVSGSLGLVEGHDWPASVAQLEEFSAAALQMGDIGGLWQAQWALAEFDIFRGEAHLGLQRFDAFQHLTSYKPEEGAPVPFLLRIVAELEAHVGRADVAYGKIKRAAEISEATSDYLHLADVYRVLGLVAMHLERWDEAETALQCAIDYGIRTHYPYGQARAHEQLGRCYVAIDQRDAATEAFRAALHLFRELGASKNAERVESLLEIARQSL